jgi:hypothetical protein
MRKQISVESENIAKGYIEKLPVADRIKAQESIETARNMHGSHHIDIVLRAGVPHSLILTATAAYRADPTRTGNIFASHIVPGQKMTAEKTAALRAALLKLAR